MGTHSPKQDRTERRWPRDEQTADAPYSDGNKANRYPSTSTRARDTVYTMPTEKTPAGPAPHRIHSGVPEVLEGEGGGQLEERRRNVFGLAQGEDLQPGGREEHNEDDQGTRKTWSRLNSTQLNSTELN